MRDVAAPTAHPWTPVVEPPPSRWRRLLVVGAVLVVGALGGTWFLGTSGRAAAPPPGYGEQAAPIGRPPVVGTGSGAYAFLRTQADGSGPVAWSPCRPIHWVLRPDGAPAGGDALLTRAFADVSAATGLQFVADGPTDEAPALDRAAYQPRRYGARWAPVLVAWSTPDEDPGLAGAVAGRAGPKAVTSQDLAVYVSGVVVLDAPQITELLATPGGAAVASAVVMHEVAHLVGLDHVDDPGQLMHGTTTLRHLRTGPGDREGLALLGAGRCAPHL